MVIFIMIIIVYAWLGTTGGPQRRCKMGICVRKKNQN